MPAADRRRTTSAGWLLGLAAGLLLWTLWSSSARASGVDPTKISLPRGPASVEGLGRDFVPSLASGTASYSIDIALPPAVRGFGPRLSLDYDAGGGASELGLGWRIGGITAIRRRVAEGLPRFDASDRFELSGVGVPCDLVEVEPDHFRPRHESGAFVRVQRSTDGERWEAKLKNGFAQRFGGPGYSEAENERAVTFLLREEQDLHGHLVRYEWDTTDGHALLQRVIWNDFSPATRIEVSFQYEARPDVYERFSSGIRQVIARRLRQIDVTYGGELVRRYRLGYEGERHSRLTTVELTGTDDETALPALRLAYTEQALATNAALVTMTDAPGRSPDEADVDLADLDGDSLPDLLVTTPGAYRTYTNHDGTRWQPPRDWTAADSPALALSSVGVQLADVDGDGAIDLVAKSGTEDFRYFPGLAAERFAAPVALRTVPSFSFEDPDVRLADMDGDRRSDAVITSESGLAIGYNRGGSDWTVPELVGEVDPAQRVRFSDGAGTTLCDVNGDRVLDFCRLRSGALAYWLGRGRGQFEPARAATGVPAFDPASPWQLHDLDGDGWVDLVHVGVTTIEYALGAGSGRFYAVQSLSDLPPRDEGATVTFADMNGSGTIDIVWVDAPGSAETAWRYLELFPEGRAGLLSHIDNGLGKRVSIRYEPAAASAARARESGAPWTTRLNVGMPVVQRVEVDSSLGDPLQIAEYTYRDGTWDPVERTFAGFAAGVATEVGDEHTPGLVLDETFDTGLEHRALRGAPLSSERRDANGAVLARETHGYTSTTVATGRDGTSVTYAYRSSLRVEHIEQASGLPPRETLSEWLHDAHGNVLEERRWGEVTAGDTTAGADEAITVRTYANDTDGWRLGYPVSEEVRDAAGQHFAARRWYYDGEPFIGLAPGEVERGDITRQELWVGPGPDDFVLDVATRYDEHGQPLETRDARGGGRVFEWQPGDPATLKSERVKLESDVELVEHAEIDPRFGNLLSLVEYSGATTRFQYDPLGRLSAVVKPGDDPAAPTLSYAYQLAAPLSRVITRARAGDTLSDIEHTETLFDGLGRQRASLARAEDTRWVLAGVDLLDARGNPRRRLRARFVDEAAVTAPPLLDDAPGVSLWHDALDRETRARSELGIEQRIVHGPLVTHTWDGAQNDPSSPYEHTPTIEQHDGLGRLVRATRIFEGTELSAHFRYDPLDQLRSKTDPEGHTARYAYDGRGNRTTIDDPDLGLRRLVYDDTGNLSERHNPDGSVLRYTYDLAGRPLSEDWDGDGNLEIAKHWDTHPEHPDDPRYRGKLARIVDPSGTTDHIYDERGRVIETTLELDGQRYTSGSRFDKLDREVLHVYPDGSSIRIQRNPRGQLAGYGDALRIEYDGDGLERERRFNTGVLQQSAYDADRRHDELVTLAADGSTIEHLKWQFDGVGSVLELQDLRRDDRVDVSPDDDRSERYEYDNLYRLSVATGSWGETRWSYSASGNLLARTSTLADQSATDIRYGSPAPHAITQLGARRLSHDASGRLTDDGERSYTWNPADQLIAVTATTGAALDNHFDAAGVRRTRSETSATGQRSTVHFISPWSEVKDGELVRYIVHADRRVARLAPDTGQAAALPPPARLGARKHDTPPALPGALALLAAAALALTWRLRAVARLPLRWLAPLTAVALLDACAADDRAHSSELPLAGSVTTLGETDTLLINDQLGTLLAETSASGTVRARFAAYPYGVTRHDTSTETQQYAGATRDETIALDHMGARFYAPDLGIWTAGDPLAINDPQRSATAEFATANPYAYANLNPTTATDPDGHFWHIAVGAGIGAALGGGIEAARQYAATGRIEDWGRVGAAAAGGAVAGAIQTALPGTGAVAMLAVGAGSGAAGGLAQRLAASGGKSAGTLGDVVVDATVGGATAGVLRGASVALRNTTARAPVASGRVLGSEAAFKRQYGELGRASARAQLPIGANAIDAALLSSRGIVGQTTAGARALAKKLGHAQSRGAVSAFSGIEPTQANAEKLIRSIMSNPSATTIGNRTMDAFNDVGQGVRLDLQTGRFVTFLEGSLRSR